MTERQERASGELGKSREELRFLRMLAKFTGCFEITNGHRTCSWTRAIYLGLSNKAVEPLARRGWLEQRRTASHATEWRATTAGERVSREWIKPGTYVARGES